MFSFFLFILAYLTGSISPAYILGKIIRKIDLRNYGSGNLGATNTFRVLGWKLSVPVLLFDFLKGLMFILLSKYISLSSLWVILIGLSVILGHIFPIYLKFKGGKGFATSAGVITGLIPPIAILCITLFILTLIITKKVSIASIITSIFLTPFYLILCTFLSYEIDRTYLYFFISITVLIIIKHLDNLKRICTNQENIIQQEGLKNENEERN